MDAVIAVFAVILLVFLRLVVPFGILLFIGSILERRKIVTM
jgi:hypothetical protein